MLNFKGFNYNHNTSCRRAYLWIRLYERFGSYLRVRDYLLYKNGYIPTEREFFKEIYFFLKNRGINFNAWREWAKLNSIKMDFIKEFNFKIMNMNYEKLHAFLITLLRVFQKISERNHYYKKIAEIFDIKIFNDILDQNLDRLEQIKH